MRRRPVFRPGTVPRHLARVRDWVTAFHRRRGRLPTTAEVGAGVGLSYSTVWTYASQLEAMYGTGPVTAERAVMALRPKEVRHYPAAVRGRTADPQDRKSTRLNSSHQIIS